MFGVLPAGGLAAALRLEGQRGGDAPAKRFETLRAQRVEGALADDECALPVVAAIEHDHDPAAIETSHRDRPVLPARDLAAALRLEGQRGGDAPAKRFETLRAQRVEG